MYDNQQQRPAPPPKTALGPDELEAIAKLTRRKDQDWLEFPPEDIAMMWDAFPDGTATLVLPHEFRLADFKRFVRLCSAKGLDPLLNDCHWEYRGDKNSPTGMKGTPIIHQGADLKIATRTGLLDGIQQKDGTDERGFYVETFIYKKGCQHPFTFKAYLREFKPKNAYYDDSPWGKMEYNMIAKCSRVGDIRIAFPEPMSGLMSEDEMHQTLSIYRENGGTPAPATPNPATAIVEKPEPVKAEVKAEPKPEAKVSEPKTPEPTSSPRRETAAPAADPKPIDPKQDATNAYKQRLAVLVGPNSDHAKAGITKAHVDAFSIGYFGVENKSQCPKDPARHIAMLDDLILQLAEPANRDLFKDDPTKFGQYRRTVLGDFAKLAAKNPAVVREAVGTISNRAELKKRFNWNDSLCAVGAAFMGRVAAEGIVTVDDLKDMVLDPAGLTGLTEPQIQTALEIGYYGAEPMGAALQHVKQNKIPLAELKAEIEKLVGGPLASWKCDPARVAESVKLAIQMTTPTKKTSAFTMPGGK